MNSPLKIPRVTRQCPGQIQSLQSDLDILVESLKSLPEIDAKRAIRFAARGSVDFTSMSLAEKYASPGDDCAAFAQGNGYQLLAMEGMLPAFVDLDPRAAGWSSVMVNVSDIAAMGGRAQAIVNAFWHNDDEKSQELMFHIRRACKVFGVTFAGGHSSINSSFSPNLAVAITGHAKRLLSCHHVKPKQRLFMLSDLNGSWHGDLPYWGCVQGKSDEQIRQQWQIPAELAEREIVVAAKDISNGGILGTLIMMLELTGNGASIDINAIPLPSVDKDASCRLATGTAAVNHSATATLFEQRLRWLRAFQSFGFLLAVEPDKVSALIGYFHGSPLTCVPIGEFNGSGKIMFDSHGVTSECWDINQEPLTEFGS